MIGKYQISNTARLHLERGTHAVFAPTVFSSAEQVDTRREQLRFNLRMAAGLYPWPKKTPLHAKFEDVGTFEGYLVKKVIFESYPGLWSTGNLYLPEGIKGKAPAIFNVIGHWDDQRLTRLETADYPQQLANFARMGFVCLVTDMIGMVDSRQLTHEYGAGEKELWGSNGLGIQLWNNIRALDLLCSLPYVDANRIGMTGASGGGSQTLFLSLLDERIKAAAPINMISLHMQGGCQCENAPGLRRETDNVEMCSMLAPRPLFLAGSTGDWTNNLLTDELPAVQAVYRLYDAADRVEHVYQDAEHQYNAKTRHHVYSFFARHLMGCDPHWTEQPIETEDLRIFTWYGHLGRAEGHADDATFFAFHREERSQAVAALSAEEKRKMLRWMIGVPETVEDSLPTIDFAVGGQEIVGIPVKLCPPENWDGVRLTLILSSDEMPQAERDRLLSDGIAILESRLFMSGMDTHKFGPSAEDPYFTTFHPTVDTCRVQDAVSLIWIAGSICRQLTVWADGASSCAAACALALTDAVKEAKLERAAIELRDDAEYLQRCYIPGIRTIGGIPGCLELTTCRIELV